MHPIATLTMNPTIDISARVAQVVAQRKLRCTPPRREPGGGGINVSRAIHRLGGESLALYTAGGSNGQLLQDLLSREKIAGRPFPIQGLTRENFIVLESSSGQQFRFGMPGPSLAEAEWRRCLEGLSKIDPKPEYLVASGSLPPGVPEDFYGQVAQWAKEKRIRTIIDSSGRPLQEAAGVGAFLLKPNIRELSELMNEEIREEKPLEMAAQQLVKNGQCEVVVVSLGAGGALVAWKEGSERLHAPTVPTKSKVGAGDSMVAGIVLALAQGRSPIEAARLGIAAGTAAVMTPGTELCRPSDVDRLTKVLGFQM